MKSIELSASRFACDYLLGTISRVRVLRTLSMHGSQLTSPQLVVFTKLNPASVRSALAELEAARMIEWVGSGRSRLFSINTRHPLSKAIAQLFDVEKHRYDRILSVLGNIGQLFERQIVAIWLYGSAARNQDSIQSDIDVLVIMRPGAIAEIDNVVRDAIQQLADECAYTLSVVTIETTDVSRMATSNEPWWKNVSADAKKIYGKGPTELLGELNP